jgi:uncharacterized protein YrrD
MMKKTREIVGLPLICVKEGIECGNIKDLLIDSDDGNVKYLIINDEEWYLGAKLLPFDKVLSIGCDAVVTDSKENIMPFTQVEDALNLIKRDANIIGARVYTQKGEYIGNISEYYINEVDGRIMGCELVDTYNTYVVDASKIITYGRGVIVICANPEDVTAYVQQVGCQEAGHGEKECQGASKHDVMEQSQGKTSDLFEQKHRRFLLGKKVAKQILGEAGELLANEGDIITDELIDRVKDGGKLVELTMNIEAV